MTTTTEVAVAAQPKASILAKMATRFSVEPNKLLETLKATAFKAQGGVSNEQMIALLIVADQYDLNPFTKEIFAFPDKGGIVPVVGVDGWARIVNAHPMFDGVEFAYSVDSGDMACTCTIYRKDRSHAIAVTEYLSECKRSTGPWGSHPRRMLRHKALIQAARLAFGFAGIYDEDEAQRIRDMGAADEVKPAGSLAAVRNAISERRAAADVIDLGHQPDPETGEVAPPSPPPEPEPAPPQPRARKNAPVAQPQLGSLDAPLERTLAQLLQDLEKAADADAGSYVLDVARHLNEQDYSTLVAAYRERFGEG